MRLSFFSAIAVFTFTVVEAVPLYSHELAEQVSEPDFASQIDAIMDSVMDESDQKGSSKKLQTVKPMTSKQIEATVKNQVKKKEEERKKIEKKTKDKVTSHYKKEIAKIQDEIEKEKQKKPVCPPPQPPTLIIQAPVMPSAK